jgi:hypothetical protein
LNLAVRRNFHSGAGISELHRRRFGRRQLEETNMRRALVLLAALLAPLGFITITAPTHAVASGATNETAQSVDISDQRKTVVVKKKKKIVIVKKKRRPSVVVYERSRPRVYVGTRYHRDRVIHSSPDRARVGVTVRGSGSEGSVTTRSSTSSPSATTTTRSRESTTTRSSTGTSTQSGSGTSTQSGGSAAGGSNTPSATTGASTGGSAGGSTGGAATSGSAGASGGAATGGSGGKPKPQ